jgi:hypothetical protein
MVSILMTSLVLPKQVRALRGRCLFVAEAIGGAIGPLAGGRAGTYILIGSHELAGDVARFLGVDGRAHGARQHRGVARHIGHDVRAGQQALQDAIEALEVGADRNFQRQDLLTLGIEEEGVGLIKLLGDQEDAVGSLDHGVDLVGSDTNTSFSSNGNCTSRDLPTPIETRLAKGKLARTGTVRTECCEMSSKPPSWPSLAIAC